MHIVPQTIHQVEENLRVANRLQRTLQALVTQRVISSLAYTIATTVNRMSRLETMLLCWSACRYSELDQIKLADIFDGNQIVITQGKTGQIRRLGRFLKVERTQFAGLNPNARVRLSDYDALRRNIYFSLPNNLKETLIGCNNSTHVFRHLRASFYYSEGWSVQEIQEYFAHKKPDATREYIHEGIFH